MVEVWIFDTSVKLLLIPRDLVLNDVVHVPQADKNLASMSRLSTDNNVFFETHPRYFFYKGPGNEGTSSSR